MFGVGRGGVEIGGRAEVGEGPVGLRVLKGREYYEARAGCKCLRMVTGGRLAKNSGITVSPMSLLKNPMILIAIVGLGFVFGMPYLMDNSTSLLTILISISLTELPVVDPDMKKEFDEQQKKSILSGGAATPNPLQNFDMAAWMAGKTAGNAEPERDESSASASTSGNAGPSKTRRRG